MSWAIIHCRYHVSQSSIWYLLHKYDALSGGDQDEFINQDIPPWQISDDSCGPLPDPPAEFTMFFAAIFSTAGDEGAQFRQILRGKTPGSEGVWLPRLASLAGVLWAFFVPEVANLLPVLREEEEYGDTVIIPGGDGSPELTAGQLKFMVSYLRDFQFRWLLVAQQDTFVYLPQLYQHIATMEPAQRTVLGGMATTSGSSGETGLRLRPHFFALTRDVHALLSSQRVLRWLRADDGEAAEDAINAWLAILSLRKAAMPGVYVNRTPGECPGDASILHPVSPYQLVLLSQAATHGPPCEVLNISGDMVAM